MFLAFLDHLRGAGIPAGLKEHLLLLEALQAGVIDRYAALINQGKVGLPGNVFVSITLNRQEQADLAAFEEAVKRVPEVMECYLMTGQQDYLLRVVVKDPADFERLHSQHLTRLPGVARVQSSFALRTVRKGSELPLHPAEP